MGEWATLSVGVGGSTHCSILLLLLNRGGPMVLNCFSCCLFVDHELEMMFHCLRSNF